MLEPSRRVPLAAIEARAAGRGCPYVLRSMPRGASTVSRMIQAKGFTGGGWIVSLLGRTAHFGTLRELSMVRKSLN